VGEKVLLTHALGACFELGDEGLFFEETQQGVGLVEEVVEARGVLPA
jgi:hypothetical protein